MFLPLLLAQGLAFLRTDMLWLHAVRAVINVAAMFLFFTALSVTELAKVTALSFTAPIFTAVLSVALLGETFRLRRWAAIVAGFVGVLIVLRPGFAIVDAGSVMVLASAAIWSVALILVKILGRTDSSFAIVAWMGIFLSVFSLGPALYVWRDPTAEGWALLAAIAATGTVAQISISQSLKETDPTAVMPFDFLKMIWATLLGLWFFAETPDAWTWAGAGVIFASGVYIAHRERRARRRGEPPG